MVTEQTRTPTQIPRNQSSQFQAQALQPREQIKPIRNEEVVLGGDYSKYTLPLGSMTGNSGVLTLTPEEANNYKGSTPYWEIEVGDAQELTAIRNVRPFIAPPGRRMTRGEFEETQTQINFNKIALARQRTAVAGFMNNPKPNTRGVLIDETATGKQYTFTNDFFSNINYRGVEQEARTQAKQQYYSLPGKTRFSLTATEGAIAVQKFGFGVADFTKSQLRQGLYGGQYREVDGRMVSGAQIMKDREVKSKYTTNIQSIPSTKSSVSFFRDPVRATKETIASPTVATTAVLSIPIVYAGGKAVYSNVKNLGAGQGLIQTATNFNPVQFRTSPRVYTSSTKDVKLASQRIDFESGKYFRGYKGGNVYGTRVYGIESGVKGATSQGALVIKQPFYQVTQTGQLLSGTRVTSQPFSTIPTGFGQGRFVNIRGGTKVIGQSAQALTATTIAPPSTVVYNYDYGGSVAFRGLRPNVIRTGAITGQANGLTGYRGGQLDPSYNGLRKVVSNVQINGIEKVYSPGSTSGGIPNYNTGNKGIRSVTSQQTQSSVVGQKILFNRINNIKPPTPTITRTNNQFLTSATSSYAGTGQYELTAPQQTIQSTRTRQAPQLLQYAPQVVTSSTSQATRSVSASSLASGTVSLQIPSTTTTPVINTIQRPGFRLLPRQPTAQRNVLTPIAIAPPTAFGLGFGFNQFTGLGAPFNFALSPGSLGIPSNVVGGGQRVTRYTPSLRALAFNIRGRKESTGQLARSGLDFRAITPNFEFDTGLKGFRL